MKKLVYTLIICQFIVQVGMAQNKMELINSFDKLEVSFNSLSELNRAYEIISEAPIALNTCKEKANNCENRAEFSHFVLSKLGFKAINFWIYKEGLIENQEDVGCLEFDTRTNCKKLFWKYHVAAGVLIQNGGKTDTFVIDPWTQHRLTTLKEWSVSFFRPGSNRTVFVFPVIENYYYFPVTAKGKLMTAKEAWSAYIDKDTSQMYCGLCGITPNRKCNKKRFKEEINKKKLEIDDYLGKVGLGQ